MHEGSLLLSKAETALAGGNFNEAELFCKALLEHASPPPRAFLIMGVIHNRRGHPEAALPYLERANGAEPNSSQVLLWLSRTLKKVGRGPEALEYALQADRHKPSDPSILHQLGSCQMDCRLFASAADSFRQAIALDGNASVLHYRLGLALLNAGDPGAAESAFRECLRLDPTSETVQAALDAAENALRSRKSRDAFIAIEEALAKADLVAAESLCQSALIAMPSDPKFMFKMGSLLLLRERYESAAEWLQKAWKAEPANPKAAIQLAYVLQRIGRLEDALPPALAAVQYLPTDPESHVQLGAIYLDQCRYPEAIQSFQRAIERDHRHLFAHRAMAQALRRSGEVKEEASVLARALQIDPESTAIRGNLVEAHLTLQQVEAAQMEARALVAAYPASLEAKCMLAECHLLDHQFDLADFQVSEALKILHPNGQQAFRLGTLLRTLGRLDEAVQLIRKSIELEPNQGAAYALLSYLVKAGETDRPRIETMKKLSTDAAMSIGERAELHYGLGKCHEDLRDYLSAMSYFDEANRLTYLHRFGRSKCDLERLGAFRDRLISALDSEIGTSRASTALDSNLPVLVFGMMRSGTTLADHILSCHREVGSIGEDLFWVNNASQFLDAPLNKLNRQRLQEVGQKYLLLLEKSAAGKTRMIDKTPANYAFAPLIHSVFPNAKFIHMIRSPADTCLSIYTTMNRVRNNWAHRKEDIACVYRNYQTVMECWRKLLPPETMMEVHYEDLATDPERVTREMVAFCRLNWDDACLHPEANKRSVLTPSAGQVRQTVYKSSIGRWRFYEPWIKEFLLIDGNYAP